MNDDTIGQILAFLGFVWFFGIIIVAIGSSNSKHTTLQDILIRQTVLTRHQAKLLRIVRTRAHLPETHPHLLRRRRIPHLRVRLIMKMPAVLILMDTMTLICNRTMTKTDTRKTAIMLKVSMMRWMMLITNMEKSIK